MPRVESPRPRPLDLDHFSAHVGKDHRTERAGHVLGHVEYADAGERAWIGGHGGWFLVSPASLRGGMAAVAIQSR
jgi:hypothetical protein